MQTFNRLTLLDACVDGEIERFKELTGDLFYPFTLFYDKMKGTVGESTPLSTVHYEREKTNVTFITESCGKEAKWNIPITKGE